ncbi:ankryin [Pigmentiphaga aceris]|uniref:Ankryin n=1 Tax=Pigmentiphaga aceris TaxID=1940612 RepID=A0A5C0AXP0_9BURK|nr:ankyrin repeat domain-containing protein [Pigmentiphaga aceris]QEI06925.1 ankryin [Pigmentiphaga aceris]
MSHLLQKAAEQGNTAKIKQLLDKGDDIEWRHKGTGRTALVSAAIAGQRDAVEVLIQHGANINHQCSAVGYSALAWAGELGLTEVADLLIKRGASLDLPSPQLKRTALMAAAQSGHIDVVRLLLDQGAAPELVDFSHDNAWTLAAERGHVAITSMLEAVGAGAPTPPKPTPVLPWPVRPDDVPATAEPALVVHAYIQASFDWETHGRELSKEGDALPDIFWQEADDIVSRYCTLRERVYKRLGFGWPPEYTPDDELLSIRPVSSRVEVLVCDAPRENGMRYEHLFVVKQAGGEWRIDSVKKRMRGTEDWSNGIL